MTDRSPPSSAIILLCAIVLAIGLAAAGFFGGQGLVKSRLGDRTVTVKGLSERPVEADLAFWPIRFVVTGNDLATVQGQVKSSIDTVTKFLTAHGFDMTEINVDSPEVTDRQAQMYNSGQVSTRFIINQLVMLRSTKVQQVADANKEANQLVEAGIVLSSDRGFSRPSYVYTKLNDAKTDMIEEALSRAREAAESFARDSGSKLAGIRRANQGQFQILPRDNAPGISESDQIDKTLRVVSTVEYLLAD